MIIDPKFKVGDKAYTRWGEELVVTEVEIDVVISYQVNRKGKESDNYWMEDELTKTPKTIEDVSND